MFNSKAIALSAIAATALAAPAPAVTTQTITATHDFGAGPTAFSWTTVYTVDKAAPTVVGAPVKASSTPVVVPTPIVLPPPAKKDSLTTQTITATADFGAGRVPFTWTTTFPVATPAATPLQVAKRGVNAGTHNPAAPGQTFCDVQYEVFADTYFIHVGEPWNGGSGCDAIYNGLPNNAGISGWSCQADGAPQSEGWQSTYLQFNAFTGNMDNVSAALESVFGINFHCSN